MVRSCYDIAIYCLWYSIRNIIMLNRSENLDLMFLNFILLIVRLNDCFVERMRVSYLIIKTMFEECFNYIAYVEPMAT